MDGESEMDDACVKAGYHTLKVYFGSPSENYSNVVGAIAQGVGEVAKLGSKISEGRQKKKFGAMDLAAKQQDAKAVITQQLLAQRQAQIEAEKSKQEISSKTKRTILIVGGSVVGLAIIGFILYKLKKK
jgi:hypothetical protein